MFVLDFRKNGERLYTIAPRRDTIVHQNLVKGFSDDMHLLYHRQHLSFYNPVFVENIRDHCSYSQGFFNNLNYHIIPDRVDVKYLR